MSSVQITLLLPDELAEDAREMDLLSSESLIALLQAEIERRKAELEEEAAWENAVMIDALGDAVGEHGDIDLEKLNARTVITSLEELYPEGDDGTSTS